jgi:hypothetical protein
MPGWFHGSLFRNPVVRRGNGNSGRAGMVRWLVSFTDEGSK